MASATAVHNPSAAHPCAAEMGWVAGDPEHKGRGLGQAVSAAVTRLALSMGYRRIFLYTEDFRLPAIKIYLRLGYRPHLFTDGMEERWRKVCADLDRQFEPQMAAEKRETLYRSWQKAVGRALDWEEP